MSKDSFCAIVTGSSSGVGAATACLLARDGARLVINYVHNRGGAEHTAEACKKLGAAAVVVVQGDVSRDEDCRKIVRGAAVWGKLDALVNNAGSTKHVQHGNLSGLSAEDFQRIYAVNTIGPYQMIRAARSLLEASAKKSGRAAAVVNVSSVAGINGDGSSLAYVGSKGALNIMSLSLAKALAPWIRVNTVCPGYIDTPWYAKGCGELRAKQIRDSVLEKVPLKTVSTAEDVAQLVYFLANSGSSNITGEYLRIDGGMHLVS
ncbi:SDR family oxidoreductase [Bradyrhizobium sp. NDS-1]|uniref:SDR family NAD(P)-dependent oxidoreductase n=1 Tax=Bradyrhizobium sp. NDS-1 TaxID=3080014 RepID=UPI00293E5063|nr:SDR family oxidoreductase [Bradyrhizobium sp. NDS-1]WOH75668.1 SDR family oxidoreductase [Bradyrhizobium sp. NDS-1]